MRHFLVHWISVAIALGATAFILPGVRVESWPALAVAALVLGLVNAVIRPLLVILTLPITVLTLGLFYFVVNGLAFGFAASLVPGFEVRSFAWAVLGALLMGVLSWFIGGFGKSPRKS